MSKKRIEIRDLLAWTYRDEMPKLEWARGDSGEDFALPTPSTWDTLERLALLGCRVDTSGPGRDHSELVFPDPDAMIVHRAVQALAGYEITMPDGWDALGDCHGLMAEELAQAHADGFAIAVPKGDRLAALVQRLAVTGATPSWRDHGPIYRRTMKGANHKPAWFRMVNASEGPGRPAVPREVEGFNPRTRRPFPGAYHKHYLDPSPAILVSERIEYQAWALALHLLATILERRLTRFFVVCNVPVWPWEVEGERRSGRVLVSLASTSAPVEAQKGA